VKTICLFELVGGTWRESGRFAGAENPETTARTSAFSN
jgi:hypothetical protein